MNSNAWFIILVLIPVLSIVVIFHNAAHAFIHQREREKKKKLNIGTDSITLTTVIFYKSGTFDWYSDTISILSGAKG